MPDLDPTYLWDTSPPNEIDINYRFPKCTTSFVILGSTLKLIDEWLHPFIQHYPWSISRPWWKDTRHKYRNKDGELCYIEYIYGELEYEEMVEDELLLVSLLMQFSTQGCYIHIWNSVEYETLLVYGADHIGSWLEGVVSLNRVWIYQGDVVILSNHEIEEEGVENFLPLQRAVAQVYNGDFDKSVGFTNEVQNVLAKHLQTYKLEEVYDISIKLPQSIAQMFSRFPWVVGRALNAWSPQLKEANRTGEEFVELVVPLGLASYAHLSLISNGDVGPEYLGQILTQSFDKLMEEESERVQVDSGVIVDNSRNLLQTFLIKQGRLEKLIPEDTKQYHSLIQGASTFENDDNENHKKSLEDAGVLKHHFEIFLEKELEKMKLEQDSPSTKALKTPVDSELADFIDYCYEQKFGVPSKSKLFEYNDDSDYRSDTDTEQWYSEEENVEAEIGDVQDRISGSDDEEDVALYDDETEVKKQFTTFEQNLTHQDND